ncbi:unconventional myosin-VIIb [Brachionichthys hirsutus]|uniref:unconventional myosin-VIIb n=1 Tax=Brachionichthys hirsutus TaxID=412623 RepID=UPI003604F129
MLPLSKGDFVWLDSGGLAIGAKVAVTDAGQLVLIDDEGKEHRASQNKGAIRPMHPTSVQGVDDMIRLGDMNEAGLLRNLLVRHKEGIIYTYTGSILVAVNPYRLLPIYTTEHVHMYTDRRLGEMPPHVFAIADNCFFNMQRNRKSQCCVISGESGAGKTESTKLMLQFMAAVSGQHSWIEQQILEANPILEAFGNAKTIRNDNSSRFGKYIDVNFTEGGAIEGARIEQYLLEKSRVCRQAPEERNYHIFYYMLTGMPADQKKILSLGNAAEYNYLTMGDCTSCEGRDDLEEYGHFHSALKILTFKESDSWEVFKLLAAILHLGNVRFEGTVINNLESCDVVSSPHFNMASQLLEVAPKELVKSLTQHSFMTTRESVTKALTSAQALESRDAFVKAIYGRLFLWIVAKINTVISKQPKDSESQQSIGLLDIFGFENFKKNSFEQLCINFANEQLQQFFVRHVFKLEQLEYARENIVWEHIDYLDNQCTLDALAIKPLNMLALIDEESHFPKGTDTTMLGKLSQNHGKGGVYTPPKNNYETQFGIQHFAGVVYYDSKGFLEKNRDALSSDLIQLVEISTNKILKQTFHKELSSSTLKSRGNPRMIINKASSSLRQVTDTKKRVPTLAGQFRQSLDSLMKTLTVCQPYFIRCIKPNDFKKPTLFDRELCIRQLRYSGMMETIKIRKAGFPVRYTFDEFLVRYRVLLKTYVCDPKTESKEKCCESICETVIAEEGNWKTGKTKIFLKDYHDTMLEMERMKELNVKALIIQKVLRGYKYRRQFLRKRAGAVVVQKYWRGHKGRKLYKVVQHGFARLQAQVRSRQLHSQYERKRDAAVLLQAQIRGRLARKEWKRQRDAVILLQAQTRGLLARVTLKKMKRDMYLSAKQKEEERQAILAKQLHLEEILMQKRMMEARSHSDPITDQEVDSIFDFLPDMARGQEGQAPVGFEIYEGRRTVIEEIDIDDLPMEEDLPEEDNDDLDEYAFSKFASMYFQGAATPTHIRQRLRQPLLYHEDESDVLASVTVWWIILRFMGDLPEPKKPSQGPPRGERLLPQDLVSRQDRRFSHTVGLDQRVLRSKKERRPPTRPDEATKPRKSSIFTDLLTRNKKASIVPNEITQNPRAYTVPEKNPQARRGSTFTDLLSRNKRASVQESVTSKSISGLTEPSIMEEPDDLTEESKTPTLQTVKEDSDVMIGEGPTLDRPLTSLEKLHIIVGYAIVRRDLRDEIYCQICKQLQDNNNRNSYFRGWILLSLCLGIFPPSERFLKHLQSLIRFAPGGYASYCAERLRRTGVNGVRGEPPAWLELQATKTKKPMIVSVTLMDGRSINLPVDSASTSREICQLLSNKVKLKDTFGFSIYVALYEKVWALGSGREHVMDAISQCEQEVRKRGGQEQHAPWRLFFRKEIFTPWHDCKEDEISTDLIYKQIIHGLKFGEYPCGKEDDLVQLAAKHLYVHHGSDSSPAHVTEAVQDCISGPLLEAKSEAKWVQMVGSAHAKSSYLSSSQRADSLKAEMVDHARRTWPMFFSRFFEVVKLSGPPLPKSSFIVAINWTGITFLDEKERRLLELSFPEVAGVNATRESKSSGLAVNLLTLKGDFALTGGMAEDMSELVTMFLSGLTERSRYAVALRDADRRDDPTFLSFKKGELLVIIKDDEFSQEHVWIKGENERTRQTGAIPTDAILILPTLSKPSDEVMSLLNLSPNQRKNIMETSLKEMGTVQRLAPSTLKEFSLEYFRQPTKDVSRQVMSRNSAPERLWISSREPIRQPLLKALEGNSDLSHKACLAFTAILKYMGDYPTKQAPIPIELTDQIFEPATDHEALRDEIYCQIMKQMTNNNNRFSVEQGWQLLWLCCGLFPPSQSLLKHAQRFLESRCREPLAADCLQRLQSSLRMEPRKLPPHQVELDAIRLNSTQIFHKVHFPDDVEEIFEVTTNTRIRDLILNIANKLSLASADGFSVFVKTEDKVLSLSDTDYFFDSLRKITDWSKKSKRIKEGGPVNAPYLVFFMRKLWFNVVPGRDTEADLMFHFPQELPKYLRGYHACTKEEVINMAALLFRIKVSSDNSQFVMIPKMLKELLPVDQLKAMYDNDWKKVIVASYNKQAGMTVDEAKAAFLKMVYRWPTFGCAFFEVKQTSEPNFPDIVRIAISKQGLTIMHPKTKVVLANHPFNHIANWCSGSTYFHMTIGSLVKGSKFLCETSLGYKMDDLISSYVNMYSRERRAVQTRNRRFNI